MRRIRTTIGLVLVNLGVLLLVAYVGHRRLMSRLPGSIHAESEVISPELLRSVGIFHDEPARRNLEALLRPKSARLRVVALGDSFTFGAEVATGFDYPSFLRKHLASAGVDAEVINLGNGWHGLSQSTRIYDVMVRDRQPDVVLLGPEGFYLDRELTFNHAEAAFFDYVHGRYIVRDGALEFLDVLDGPTGGYYRFPPRARYLLHDRSAPPFLRGLLPAGRSLANPFYASMSTAEEERDELFPRLFERIAEGSHRTVVVHGEPEIGPLVRGGALALHIPQRKGALYQRPGYHYSGTGNDMLARRFCAAIVAQACPPTRTITLHDARQPLAEGLGAEADALGIIVGETRVAFLHEVNGPPASMRGARQLLALGREAGRSPLDGVWLRLPQILGCETVEARYDDGTIETIGTIEPLEPTGSLAAAVFSSRWFNRGRAITAGGFDPASLPATVSACGQDLVSLQAQGAGPPLTTSLGSALVVFSPGDNDWLDVDALGERGEVLLSIDGRSVPFGSWHKE